MQYTVNNKTKIFIYISYKTSNIIFHTQLIEDSHCVPISS